MIAAEGEQKASQALKEASEIIAESSSALQLRYLQVTQSKISLEISYIAGRILHWEDQSFFDYNLANMC